MIFQCSDLERALRTPELMPEMREHAGQCEACSRQLYVWAEISRLAPELHQEWESPFLWPRIRAALAAQAPPPQPMAAWRWVLAAAAVALLAVALGQPWRSGRPRQNDANPAARGALAVDLLTETALREVQQTEAAYTRSIDRLSVLAAPGLQQSPSPVAAAYREKLVLLDSAIADLKANVESNRYNTYMQLELASLYQAKQKTLRELLESALQDTPQNTAGGAPQNAKGN